MLKTHFNFSQGIEIPVKYMLWGLECGTARAVGSVAFCSNGFQSVAHFRLQKIEIHPNAYHKISNIEKMHGNI